MRFFKTLLLKPIFTFANIGSMVFALTLIDYSSGHSASSNPSPELNSSKVGAAKGGSEKNLPKDFQSNIDKIIRGNYSGIDTLNFLADLENRIARTPGQDKWLAAAGILHFQVGRYAEARKALIKIRKPTLGDERLLALSLFEIKEYRKSLIYFRHLQDIRTSRGDWEKYCQALSIGGSKTEALKEWEEYHGRYGASPATTNYDKLSGAGQYDGLDFLAESYRRLNQKEKLIPILETLIKKNKGKEEEGKLLLELSVLYGETNLKAIDLRAQYLSLHPEDFNASNQLALMYEARGEIKKALSIYLNIAPNFSQDLKFNRHLGEILSKSDPEKALLYYETCKTLAPKSYEILLEIARLQETMKRPELALEAYKAVLDVNPTQQEAKARMIALAGSSKTSGPWLQAMVENEKKNPKDHAYQFQLAKLFFAAQDKENPYKFLQKALINSPNNEEYMAFLPEVISSDAQILKHFPILQKLALQPNANPKALLLVGRGFSLYHNAPRAAEAYSRVLASGSKILEGHRQPILDLFSVKDYAATSILSGKYLEKDGKDIEIRHIQVTLLSETNAPAVKMRSAIQGLVELEPYDDKWYLRLAELDLAAKDTTAALKHGQEWMRMHPEDKRGLNFL